MRRRRHVLQVSTFPFLAVLLCAMGSLILLLLVIDRRAKAFGRAKAALAITAKTQFQVEQEKMKEDEWIEARRRLHESLEEELQEVRGKTERTQHEIGTANTDLAKQKTQDRQWREQLAAEKERCTVLISGVTARKEELAKTDKHDSATESLRRQMTADLMNLEQTLADLTALRKREQRTFSLIPYKGRRGENRNPVYLECTGAGWTFHPDMKTLLATDEGAKHLRSELESRLPATAAAKESAAYLFLLVRPDGISNYYRAQAAMHGLPVDFGYEFVDASWILDFSQKPNADLAAPVRPPFSRDAQSSERSAGPRLDPPHRAGAIALGSGAAQRQSGGSAGPGTGSSGSGIDPAATAAGPAPSLAAPHTGGGDGSPFSSSGQGARQPQDPSIIGRPRASFEDESAARISGQPSLIASDKRVPDGMASSDKSPFGADTTPGQQGAVASPSQQQGVQSRDRQGAVAHGAVSPDKRALDSLAGSDNSSVGAGTAPGEQSGTGNLPQQQGVQSRDRQGAVAHGPVSSLPDGRGSDGNLGTAPPKGVRSSGTGTTGADSDSSLEDEAPSVLASPSLPRLPSGRANNAPAPPVRLSRLTGNRDWIIPLECTAQAVTLPGGTRVPSPSLADGDRGAKALLQGVQQLIDRKQATVRPGEPAFRPQVRFMVRPDGLRTYHLAYPTLEPLNIPILRQNLAAEDPNHPSSGGRTP